MYASTNQRFWRVNTAFFQFLTVLYCGVAWCTLHKSKVKSEDSFLPLSDCTVLQRGLKHRSTDLKKKASTIVGNMCNLVSDPKDVAPYLNDLVPILKSTILDPSPEVCCARVGMSVCESSHLLCEHARIIFGCCTSNLVP